MAYEKSDLSGRHFKTDLRITQLIVSLKLDSERYLVDRNAWVRYQH